MTRSPKPRKPRKALTIVRDLENEFEPECATANECIDERQAECPINRFRALLDELRAALKQTKAR